MVTLVGSKTASAQCKPAVVAQGDPALVTGLTTRLAANGIATSSTDGCPTLRVNIEQRGTQLHVRLADASQRTGERDVQDIATAAAVVESWTYQEIEAGTLPEVPPEAPPIVLGPRRTTRSGISASMISGLGTDGATTWIGGSISACVRISSLCAGATLRSQLDTRASGDTSAINQSLYTLGALATLDLPRKLGSFILSPGIGVGYTYLHVTTTHRDAMMNPFDIPTADHQLRGGAHAALLKSLSDHVGAFADLWVDAAALRSDSQFGPAAYVSFALGLRFEER
jgi:hypothetical protein